MHLKEVIVLRHTMPSARRKYRIVKNVQMRLQLTDKQTLNILLIHEFLGEILRTRPKNELAFEHLRNILL